MRNLNSAIKDAILKSKAYIYCFEINFLDKKKIFLSSSSKPVKSDNINYYPYSGLQLTKAVFTDTAKDYIILEGIFEELGITRKMILLGAKVKILIKFPQNFYHLVTYYVVNYTKYDLSFTMRLEPEAIKYNQTIVNHYSKTCRAILGDHKCQVELKNYSFAATVIELDGNFIKITPINCPNGYLNEGSIYTIDMLFITKIISNYDQNIEINQEDKIDIRLEDKLLLVAGCDKKWITCCNKFNNAVNFRGEPFIPTQKFLSLL